MSQVVIDADGHVMETEATWASLDKRYEAWRPRWVRDEGFLETSIELGDVADKDANGRTAPVNQHGADDAPALVLDETALPPHPELAAGEGR